MRFWLTLVVGVFVARADDGLQAGEKSEGDVAAEDVEGSSTAYEHSITVNEIEALVKRGEYFFLAVISREGPRCAEFIEKIPQINAAIAKVNQTLKVYTMDFGEALSELSTEERIRGVPAVMMFVGNRDAIVFHYQPDPELIAKFAERVIATTVKRIEPPMTMEGFEKSATDASVVFVVEDEDYELDFIMTLARRNLHASFGYVLREADNAENLTDYIYVKRVDRERRSIGRVPQRSLANFVKLETHQPLFRYPQDSDVISSAFEDSVIFYLGKSTEIHANSEWLEKLGNSHRGEFVVVSCDVDDPDVQRGSEHFHFSKGDPARVRILVKSISEMYLMEDSITEPVSNKTVVDFIDAFRSGRLRPFLRSAELPEDWDKRPLKTIVANNYTEFVSQGTHTVVVLLHNPEHTEEIATMEKVAEHYKNVDDILIAKMDMTANDMPGRHAAVRRIVPAVRLYEKYLNNELFLREDITVENVKKFIRDATRRFFVPPSARRQRPETKPTAEPEAALAKEERDEATAKRVAEPEIVQTAPLPTVESTLRNETIVQELKHEEHEEL
ncbi:unnamed protein product [Heligmosomoides polygyrus]|uniref:Thioredoxin domain-containing protein n=1 Tax=Heligmosomoides polygyrus TaxID=6339 RepID=A0A3P7WRQ6_HELPZ|nr:unnamed protein product [Heligmosomoides polygyrus]